MRSLLDAYEEAAKEGARDGDAARVHDWMRACARPTEDAVSLSAPAVGIAAVVDALSRMGFAAARAAEAK